MMYFKMVNHRVSAVGQWLISLLNKIYCKYISNDYIIHIQLWDKIQGIAIKFGLSIVGFLVRKALIKARWVLTTYLVWHDVRNDSNRCSFTDNERTFLHKERERNITKHFHVYVWQPRDYKLDCTSGYGIIYDIHNYLQIFNKTQIYSKKWNKFRCKSFYEIFWQIETRVLFSRAREWLFYKEKLHY